MLAQSRQPDCSLVASDGEPIMLKHALKEIHPVCIVSDHYPALNFQARQFLVAKATDTISLPMITDTFALDAITEMLETPLQLLSYFDQRSKFSSNLIAMHELTTLSYHLKNNLWIGEENSMLHLADDISTDLDVAMNVRREGLDGSATPDGILTRFDDTPTGTILAAIEFQPIPETIGLGLLFLQMDGESMESLNEGIKTAIAKFRKDALPHNITIGISKASSGLTVHCNKLSDREAGIKLLAHCQARKYREKAKSWYGVAIRPKDGSVRFATCLDFDWEHDSVMDERTRDM